MGLLAADVLLETACRFCRYVSRCLPVPPRPLSRPRSDRLCHVLVNQRDLFVELAAELLPVDHFEAEL